jgi:hypothetical protein
MDRGQTQVDLDRQRRRAQLLAELASAKARRSAATDRRGPGGRPDRIRHVVEERRRTAD